MRVGAIQFLAGSDVHQCGSRISTAVTQYGGFAVHHSQNGNERRPAGTAKELCRFGRANLQRIRSVSCLKLIEEFDPGSD